MIRLAAASEIVDLATATHDDVRLRQGLFWRFVALMELGRVGEAESALAAFTFAATAAGDAADRLMAVARHAMLATMRGRFARGRAPGRRRRRGRPPDRPARPRCPARHAARGAGLHPGAGPVAGGRRRHLRRCSGEPRAPARGDRRPGPRPARGPRRSPVRARTHAAGGQTRVRAPVAGCGAGPGRRRCPGRGSRGCRAALRDVAALRRAVGGPRRRQHLPRSGRSWPRRPGLAAGRHRSLDPAPARRRGARGADRRAAVPRRRLGRAGDGAPPARRAGRRSGRRRAGGRAADLADRARAGSPQWPQRLRWLRDRTNGAWSGTATTGCCARAPKDVRLRDSRGLHYLRDLLARPAARRCRPSISWRVAPVWPSARWARSSTTRRTRRTGPGWPR